MNEKFSHMPNKEKPLRQPRGVVLKMFTKRELKKNPL